MTAHVLLLTAILCVLSCAFSFQFSSRPFWKRSSVAEIKTSAHSAEKLVLLRVRAKPRVRVMMSTTEVAQEQEEEEEGAMVFTEDALKHIDFLKSKQGEAVDVILRMGVRAGGCSGMSYVMDFIKDVDVTEDDHEEMIMGNTGDPLAKMVIDPKSLMYLFGMQLDYSDELIGGGFKFNNPNAETSCGCGKSFGV